MAERTRLPEVSPEPDEPIANLLSGIVSWAAIIGLAVPAWSIGAPWGWFAYAGTVVLLMGLIELRQLNNILVRTLPALRILVEDKEGRGRKVEGEECLWLDAETASTSRARIVDDRC